MNKKRRKITSTAQRVACDILVELEVYMMRHQDVPEEISRLYDRVFEDYALCRDPFTGMVCTSEECRENSLEYDRQTMMERYGHCDGLE